MMIQPETRRNRGRVLTDKGFEKVSNVISKKFEESQERPSLEAISRLTDPLYTKLLLKPVSKDTVNNILKRRRPVDKTSLEALFEAFKLELEPDDHTSPASQRGVSTYLDWGVAPDIYNFYGRVEELATLEDWIINNHCQVVNLWGLTGIGKTALVVNLVTHIKQEFKYIVWKSLKDAPQLKEFLTALIGIFSAEQETKDPLFNQDTITISTLIKCLQKHRCLLVLDGTESLLQAGERAGHYRQEYKEYGELFTRLGETEHQSCLVLIGWEQPREISRLEQKIVRVRSLEIKGLEAAAAKEILKLKELADQDKWGELIERYGGNPLALELVAVTIRDFFMSKTSEFLEQNTRFLNNDFSELLDQQLQRLSELETEIMYWLVIESRPISMKQFAENIVPSFSSLHAALESLQRRALIETIEESEVFFALQTVVRDYIQKQLVAELVKEIRGLIQNAIIKPNCFIMKYNLNKNLDEKIVLTIKDQLQRNYRISILQQRLNEILSKLREQSIIEVGYAEANLEKLLLKIRLDLKSS